MIADRQKLILEAVIEQYIDSAQPVSSKLLEEKYGFPVCPATIRNDMQKLTELGYLHQPHTSAGRVPTDRAYRFLVDNLLEQEILELKDVFDIESILHDSTQDIFQLASNLLKSLAESSSSLAVVHFFNKDFVWKEGWEELLKEPEFSKKDFVYSFTKFLKGFEESIKELEIDSDLRIFIGQENPVSKINDFSVISSRCYFPNKEKAMLSLFGPKRMDYNKNISLMNSLTKLLSEF
jgi:transcriptional regulator of heat shock response